MELLTFEVSGKMAHFRKYYANNTALSFSIPPRTTLMGMLATVLGLPRDTYYEALSSGRIRLGVGVVSPLKKSFHRLNFLSIKSKSDFDGSGGRIQTPFEVVTGLDLNRDEVRYRVFVACHEAGRGEFDALRERLITRSSHFALTLGTANFTATLSQVLVFPPNQVAERTASDWVDLHSAVPSARVRQLPSSLENGGDFSLEEELLPADFVANNNRELAGMNRAVFTTDGEPLRLRLDGSFYEATSDHITYRFLFLE